MATKKKGVKTPETPVEPRIKTIRAIDVEVEELEYLWLDRFPRGAITLVGGRPKQGKSLLTYFLAAQLTARGEPVLMSNPEDRLGVSKVPRSLAAGCDPRLMHFWPTMKIKLPDDVEFLEELVTYHKIGLVTIDPIAKHLVARNPAEALEPLAAMAERTNCAIVGVHHIVKRMPHDAHPMDAFGGPYGGWIGTARSAFVFGPTAEGDEGSRFLVEVADNEGKGEKAAVEFYLDDAEVDMPDGTVRETGRVTFVSDAAAVQGGDIVNYRGGDGTGFKHQGAGGEKLQAAVELLTLLLRHGPVPAKDIFDKIVEIGVSKMTARRAADELAIVKHRVGFGPGSYLTWELPPNHPILSVGKPTEEADLDAELKALLEGKLPAPEEEEVDET